jgi:arogenate dehydrogenase (NADP+)
LNLSVERLGSDVCSFKCNVYRYAEAELFDRLHTLIRDDIFDEAASGGGGGGEGSEGASASGGEGGGTGEAAEPSDRSFKDRLTDQVNSSGTIGGDVSSSQEADEKEAAKEAPSR